LVTDGYHCEPDGTAGGDASVDTFVPPIDAPAMNPNDDFDGDGIKNGVDNCPLIANANQHNEDGDVYGDACDPCPIIASLIEIDSDGDGVGNNCDPHPNTPGDAVYLFETFANGVPAASVDWDPFGPWTGANDGVAVAATNGHANLGYTMPVTGKETIFTAVTITAVSASAVSRGAGTIDEKNAAGTDGASCEIYLDSAGTTDLGVVHASAGGGTDIMSTAFTWATGTKYAIKQTRTGDTYDCEQGATKASGSLALANQTPEVGFYIANASARFEYLYVVTSP
jgi:hypothetical protein